MIIPIALLAVSLVSAQTPSANPGDADSRVSSLKERFVEATDEPARIKLLDQIAATRPISAQDVSALFDMFSRFADPELRRRIDAERAQALGGLLQK